MRDSEADKLRAQAARLIAEAEKLEAKVEPGPEGTVIQFAHRYAKEMPIYHHVAINVGKTNGPKATKDRWQTSAGTDSAPVTWDTLCKRYPELNAGRYAVATGWDLRGDAVPGDLG